MLEESMKFIETTKPLATFAKEEFIKILKKIRDKAKTSLQDDDKIEKITNRK